MLATINSTGYMCPRADTDIGRRMTCRERILQEVISEGIHSISLLKIPDHRYIEWPTLYAVWAFAPKWWKLILAILWNVEVSSGKLL